MAAAAAALPLPLSSAKSAPTETSALVTRGEGQLRFSFWKLFGPGLLACLADTDAGCLIVAAQSGSRWGYSLLLLQIVLIPVLFMTQELTVRLAVHTRQGQVACIQQFFGRRWAILACSLLVAECLLAMVSEMSGIAAVAELWGVPRGLAALGSATLIISIIFACTYKQVEALGIFVGLFELTFVATMVFYHPSPLEIFRGAFTFHSDVGFLKLVAANVGAVIMPWMIYFQQSALVARRVQTDEDIAEERASTLVGSVLTQLIMVGALVTLAAAHGPPRTLETVADIVEALSPVLGVWTSRLLVSLALSGGSLAAAFVVTLASSWAVCDLVNQGEDKISLDASPSSARTFYGFCLVFVLIGLGVLETGINIVQFNMVVEFINGLLLPFTVLFLFLLCTGDALPPHARVVGRHKVVIGGVFCLCAVLCLATTSYGLYVGRVAA